MTIDIIALDALPETEPTALADLDDLGLRPCDKTCQKTCIGTCFFTDW